MNHPTPCFLSVVRRAVLRSVVAAVLLSAIFPVAGAGTDPARDQWIKGYEKLEQARQAEDDGRRELAASLYRSALEVFSDVAASHPEWNPALLRYRIRFCKERIEALREGIDAGIKTLSKNELLEMQAKHSREMEKLQGDLRSRERELQVTSEAVERARREAARNAAARDQVDGLMKEKQALAEDLERVRKKLLISEEALKTAREDDRERRRANLLQDKLTVGEAENRKVAAQLATALADLARTDGRLREVSAERETVRAEALKALAESEQRQQRIAALEKAGADLTARLGAEKEAKELALQRAASAEKRAEDSLGRAGTLQGRVKELEDQLQQVKKAKDDVESQVAVVPGQLDALRQMIAGKDREIAGLNEKLTKAAVDLDAKEQQQVRLKGTADGQAAELARLQGQVAGLVEQNTATAAALAETRAKLEHASEGRTDTVARLDRYREQLAGAENDRDMAVRQAESRLSLLRQQEHEIRALKGDLEKLGRSNEDLETKLAAALAAASRPVAVVPVTDPGSSPEHKAMVAELKGKLDNALTEREYHRQKAEEAARDLQNAESRLTAVERQLAAKTAGEPEMLARFRQELDGVQGLFEREKERSRLLEAKLLERPAAPARKADADVVNAFLHKGVEAERQGNVEAAVWNYKQALTADEGNVVALRRLGALAVQAGSDQEAIAWLHRAFRADPDHLATLQQLGFALVRQEQPDMALSMLARAAALDQDDPDVHKQLGVALSTLGWKQAAEVQFRRALKLAPADSEAAFNLAVLLAADGDARMPEARTWYKTARDAGAEADPALDQFFKYQKD